MKCEICGTTKAMKCSKCDTLVCRQHYAQFFDETTRKLRLLCHNCSRAEMDPTYAPRRRKWKRRRYY